MLFATTSFRRAILTVATTALGGFSGCRADGVGVEAATPTRIFVSNHGSGWNRFHLDHDSATHLFNAALEAKIISPSPGHDIYLFGIEPAVVVNSILSVDHEIAIIVVPVEGAGIKLSDSYDLIEVCTALTDEDTAKGVIAIFRVSTFHAPETKFKRTSAFDAYPDGSTFEFRPRLIRN